MIPRHSRRALRCLHGYEKEGAVIDGPLFRFSIFRLSRIFRLPLRRSAAAHSPASRSSSPSVTSPQL